MTPRTGKSTDQFATDTLHRRQKFTQILLPLILAAAGILGTAILLVLSIWNDPAVGTNYANLSLIIMIFPVMLASIGLLAVFIGIIYGQYKLLQVLPVFSLKVRVLIYRAAIFLRQIADGATKPIFTLHSIFAVIQTILNPFRIKTDIQKPTQTGDTP